MKISRRGSSVVEHWSEKPGVDSSILSLAILSLAVLTLSSCVPQPGAPGAPGAQANSSNSSPTASVLSSSQTAKTDPLITSTLINLFDNLNQETVTLNNTSGTPLGDIISIGTPTGFRLRNHYTHIGIPITEALSLNTKNSRIRKELKTMARWSTNYEVRSEALIILANRHNLADEPVFKEALLYFHSGVRFGALEALAVWGHPHHAIPLIKNETDPNTEGIPILNVYAAGLLARLGDPSGVPMLRSFVSNPSWVVRAMAAQYLGDYGDASDYDRLVNRINQEQQYNFVVAEDCIAAIKLFPKKQAAGQ